MDPLSIAREEMRRLGYRTIDLLVDRLSAPPGPVIGRATPDEMHARLATPPPEGPCDYETILADLTEDVLPFMARASHPRDFAFIPGEGTWPGALGDLIGAALNIDACWWLGAAGPSELELLVLDWFKGWLGYPPTASGVLVSGGSAANMTALACARELRVGSMRDDLVVYVSDQTHSSVARAARVLGFRPDQVRVLPVDDGGRLRLDALCHAIAADRRAGRTPLSVVANAGTTNSGAVDPFHEIAAICAAEEIWLHVDGAYGGFAVLTERGRGVLAGIDLADSITLDPHKWLFQPFECGALLIREGSGLRTAFEITPDYLKDVEVLNREVNFSDLGVQLTRSARALKLWMSLRYFGVAAFRQAIDQGLDLVQAAAARIDRSPALELLSAPQLGIVCFRRHPDGVDDEEQLDALNAKLVAGVDERGVGFVSSTRIKGRYAIRLCVLNHSSTAADVDAVLDFLEYESAGVSERAVPELDRNPAIELGWLRRPTLDAVALRAIPLFASLDDDAVARVLHGGRERTAAIGDTIVVEGSDSREFFVVLEGAVDVTAHGELVGRHAAGGFFGEIAALDWGASFGRVRRATVTATAPTRLLVLEWQLLNRLVRASADLGEQVNRALRQRLRELP